MEATEYNSDSGFKVERFVSSKSHEWNEFVSKSKNATFLLSRNFMEYHKDRFEDFSLMVYKNKKLVALLPANKVGNAIHSHQGLSYGGLILYKTVKFSDVLGAFKSLLEFLHANGMSQLNLKPIPKIYHYLPSDEMDYLLFLLKADIQKKETLSVIDQNHKSKIASNRLEGVKRGQKSHLTVKEESHFGSFWNTILSVNIKKKYKVEPVHSLEEIGYLKTMFPENIRQFNVYHDTTLVAGTTIFESKLVAHCQYISANEDKNALGSLDFLHHHLITNVYKDKKYYDFGSSNEANGTKINNGLHYWKEGFGARTIIQEFYCIPTENYHLLTDVLK